MKILHKLLTLYAVSALAFLACHEDKIEQGFYELHVTHLDSTEEIIVYQQLTDFPPEIKMRKVKELLVYYPDSAGVKPYIVASDIRSVTIIKKQ